MDDALARPKGLTLSEVGLIVLILVVMDDALAPHGFCCSSCNRQRVLILVVMDDALAHGTVQPLTIEVVSLNPCCNG